MPDVTSTLLAMYQQIIGGSSAREQSALEAECARRVIISGLTIAANGAFTVPGNVTVGGSLTITGTFSVTGLLTVGSLAVTGNATVGSLTVTGAATVGGVLTASGGLSVTDFGSHPFIAGGVGANSITVQNSAAGTSNLAAVYLANDLGLRGQFLVGSSTLTPTGPNQADGVSLVGAGAGGLSIWTAQAAPIRFYTGVAGAERLRIAATGQLLYGTTANPFSGNVIITGDSANGSASVMIVTNTNAGNTGGFLWFLNAASVAAGSITQTAATTVAYNTSSDARLKDDRGRATDLAALRGVVVHDFTWKADGTRARGVFAQDAYPLFPAAVTPGTDDTTDDGSLARPWMTDYSKFVPDLIVGWQQHDAELAALRALLAGIQG